MSRQLTLDLVCEQEQADCCPYCGEDWICGETTDAIYGCDIRSGNGERFLVWAPCCEGMAADVASYGFEDAYGTSVAAVAELIGGYEVLEVIEDGDGTVVARLRVEDPTEVTAPRTTTSPAGWFTEVSAEVEAHHRHHRAPQGHKFSVAVYNGGIRVGVAVVGRPVSRRLQAAEPGTLEVTRLCTWGHSALRRNAASKLYAACGDTARRAGYDKLITYTLEDEGGHSLRASGWTLTRVSAGGSWSRRGRARQDKAPTCRKLRWERGLTKATRRAVQAAALSEEEGNEASSG